MALPKRAVGAHVRILQRAFRRDMDRRWWRGMSVLRDVEPAPAAAFRASDLALPRSARTAQFKLRLTASRRSARFLQLRPLAIGKGSAYSQGPSRAAPSCGRAFRSCRRAGLCWSSQPGCWRHARASDRSLHLRWARRARPAPQRGRRPQRLNPPRRTLRRWRRSPQQDRNRLRGPRQNRRPSRPRDRPRDRRRNPPPSPLVSTAILGATTSRPAT